MPIDKQNRHAYNSGMRTREAIEHFGTQGEVAKALGMKQSSVAEWGEYPPALRQIHLQTVTRGKLRAEPECFRPERRKKKA